MSDSPTSDEATVNVNSQPRMRVGARGAKVVVGIPPIHLETIRRPREARAQGAQDSLAIGAVESGFSDPWHSRRLELELELALHTALASRIDALVQSLLSRMRAQGTEGDSRLQNADEGPIEHKLEGESHEPELHGS